ncbi:MAG: hypothetical protein EBZ48_08360, partial [Proteobacteria bacterium]|nr:hypothetical protein [Pseudomonadota bacterium]
MELATKNKRSSQSALISLVILVALASVALTSCSPVGITANKSNFNRADGSGGSAGELSTASGSDLASTRLSDELTDIRSVASSTRILSKAAPGVVGVELIDAQIASQLIVHTNVSAEKVVTT